MSLVTGRDAHLPHHSFIFDQCMMGAKMDGEYIKKKTRLESDFEFQQSAPTCDGTHKHMILRGSNKNGPRTAQAAVYPAAMCDLILDEIQTRSSKIRSGGRIPAFGANYVDEIEKKVPTLSKILPELRLLAVHKGKQYEKAFDKMVVPWARHALGCVPHQLQYDADLSMLQILTWKTPITEKEETTTASEGSSGKRAPAGRREPPSSNAAAIQSNHAQVAGHQSGHVTDAIGMENDDMYAGPHP